MAGISKPIGCAAWGWATVKQQLDALRSQGYTINGYIRSLIERDLKKGR